MKTILNIMAIIVFLLLSCQLNQTHPNLISGKLKTLSASDSLNNTPIEYEFYYDNTGNLTTINKDNIAYISIVKMGDTTFRINRINENGINEMHNIHYNNQGLVTHIDYQVDTIIDGTFQSFYLPVFEFYYNGIILDSMYESFGSGMLLPMSNIQSHNLDYSNNNCMSYEYTYESFPPPVISPSYNEFLYDSILYDKYAPFQEIVVSSSTATFLGEYLLTLPYLARLLGLIPGHQNYNLISNSNRLGSFSYTLDNLNRVNIIKQISNSQSKEYLLSYY